MIDTSTENLFALIDKEIWYYQENSAHAPVKCVVNHWYLRNGKITGISEQSGGLAISCLFADEETALYHYLGYLINRTKEVNQRLTEIARKEC